MKLRHPFLLRIAGFVAAILIRLLLLTIRKRIVTVTRPIPDWSQCRKRYFFAVWHDSIVSMMYLRSNIDVLISHHADGQLVTHACRNLGFGVVRGSSSCGGPAALMMLVERAKTRHLFVTPDGPRGPRHVVRPGLVYVAALTGLPIVLIAVGYSRAWYLKTWDRMAIPKPFSTTFGVVSEPISIPADVKPEDLGHYCGRIEERFLQLTATAERWAETGRVPGQDEMAPVASMESLPQCA